MDLLVFATGQNHLEQPDTGSSFSIGVLGTGIILVQNIESFHGHVKLTRSVRIIGHQMQNSCFISIYCNINTKFECDITNLGILLMFPF